MMVPLTPKPGIRFDAELNELSSMVGHRFFEYMASKPPVNIYQGTSYISGIDQLLSIYAYPLFESQAEIDKLVQKCDFASVLNGLNQLHQKARHWNVGRLVQSLYALGNIAPLMLFVEAIPARVQNHSPVQLKARSGSSITLYCVADGFPKPQFDWYKISGTQPIQFLDFKTVNANRTEVVISNCCPADSGDYICEVYNIVDQTRSKEPNVCIHLEVDGNTAGEPSYSEPCYARNVPPPLLTARGFKPKYKVALLIGQSNYSYTCMTRLKAPPHDIAHIAKYLHNLSFHVIRLFDLDKKGMESVFKFYSKLLSKDVYSFVYIASHGCHINGIDYSIPVDSDGANASTMVSIKWIEHILQSVVEIPSFNLLIADMCRTEAKRVDNQAQNNFESQAKYPQENLITLYVNSINKEAFERKIDPASVIRTPLLQALDNECRHRNTISVFVNNLATSIREINKSKDMTPQVIDNNFNDYCLNDAPRCDISASLSLPSTSNLVKISVPDLLPKPDLVQSISPEIQCAIYYQGGHNQLYIQLKPVQGSSFIPCFHLRDLPEFLTMLCNTTKSQGDTYGEHPTGLYIHRLEILAYHESRRSIPCPEFIDISVHHFNRERNLVDNCQCVRSNLRLHMPRLVVLLSQHG